MGQNSSQPLLEGADDLEGRLRREPSEPASSPGPIFRERRRSQSKILQSSPPAIVFSSQAPGVDGRDRIPRPKRPHTSQFERASSPSDTDIKLQPTALSALAQLDDIAPPEKSKKNKKRRARHTASSESMASAVGEEIHPLVPEAPMDVPLPADIDDPTMPIDSIVDDSAVVGEDDAGARPDEDESANFSPENVRHLSRKEKKELKRAKKAEKLRMAQLGEDPNFSSQVDPASSPQAAAESVTQVDDEQLPPSKKRRRQNRTEARADPDASARADDEAEVELANSLPTPDTDVQTIENPTLVEGDLAGPSHGAASASESTALKRKAGSSEKKQRKKQKRHPEVGASDVQDNSALDNGTTNADPAEGPSGAGKPDSFGDLAQKSYLQRYSGQKPPLPIMGAAIKNLVFTRPTAQDQSPSIARAQRRALLGSVEAAPADEDSIKRDLGTTQEELTGQSMDIDAGRDDLHGMPIDPALMEPQQHNNVPSDIDIAMAEASVKQALGSEDARLASSGGIQEVVEEESSTRGAATEALKSPQGPELPASEIKSEPRASTGRKRVAKKSFLERDQADNANAFAELPSPAAVVAARKRHQPLADDDNAAAGPSSAAGKRGRQTKISSMMNGETEYDSTPSSSRHNSRRRKVKDPSPGEEATGPFSEFELRNIDVAIQHWKQDHDLADNALIEMIHKNPQVAKSTEFWEHVQAACPMRKRQKIINACRRKYHNFVARGTWTPEQHEELARAYEMHGPKYRIIGQLLNRHPEDVRDRIRNYVICGDHRKTDAWSDEEVDRLLFIINHAIESIRDLKEEQKQTRPDLQLKKDDELIDWQVVSSGMDHTRSRLQCMTKWKAIKAAMERRIDGEEGGSVDDIIHRARADVTTMSHRDRYSLVKAVGASGAHADSRIPWYKLRHGGSKLGDKWSRPTMMLAWYRLRLTVPDYKVLSVSDIADKLSSTFQETGELNFLSEEEMDLEAEHREIAHKIDKVVRPRPSHNKTPAVAAKSDDEHDGDNEDSMAVDPEEAEAPKHSEQSQALSGEDIVMPGVAPAPMGEGSGIDIGFGQHDVPIDPEIANAVIGLPADAEAKEDASDVEDQDNMEVEAAAVASKEALSPRRTRKGKGKGKGKRKPRSAPEDSDSSSDTNAEDAEDIPSRV